MDAPPVQPTNEQLLVYLAGQLKVIGEAQEKHHDDLLNLHLSMLRKGLSENKRNRWALIERLLGWPVIVAASLGSLAGSIYNAWKG